jgi:predicted ATP-dependent endonuclease of OLD family
MRLKTFFLRFYKSFNFDYLRKFHSQARPFPWETIDGQWYPYVRIPIDSFITTVVGANESGKTHLLSAIRKAITGKGIDREDFCRYSHFFTVEKDKMVWPDFGMEWVEIDDKVQEVIRKACNIQNSQPFDRFFLFRSNQEDLRIYLLAGNDIQSHEVLDSVNTEIISILPQVFSIDSSIALPESVPLRVLIDGNTDGGFRSWTRSQRHKVLETVYSNHAWFTDPSLITQHSKDLATSFSSLADPEEEQEGVISRARLAHDLIFKVANIDPAAIEDLHKALERGREGYVNGIVQEINDRLESALNFPSWWVQDKDFRLLVSPREYDLVFTIKDKTGTEYSFNERSSGLQYFLSYYIQYLAHDPNPENDEILLMDEPDAFLSSQAQQDLLKIFAAFANPEGNRKPVQVLYVTHSPFLIDKNHAERIRVLEKGVGEEGTRVVRDASRNHYEPLRSAFGAYVGETTFIGNCNLMVEGLSDQILLAGMATHLTRKGAGKTETLDLNQITIVPAGSASHIPYLVYLARGRDIEQPAVIVLLDSDKSGDSAAKQLKRGGPQRKQLLKEEYVLQVGDIEPNLEGSHLANDDTRLVIEDLVPPELAALAAQQYLKDVCGADPEEYTKISADAIVKAKKTGEGLVAAIDLVISGIGTDAEYHIEKVGFARSIIDIVTTTSEGECCGPEVKALEVFESNMKVLFTHLQKAQRAAERELNSERVSRRFERAKKSFLQDHPLAAKKEEVLILLEDLDNTLGNDPDSDKIRVAINGLKRDHQIETNLTEPICDFEQFKGDLERVRYAGRIATQVADPTLRLEASPVVSREGAISDA